MPAFLFFLAWRFSSLAAIAKSILHKKRFILVMCVGDSVSVESVLDGHAAPPLSDAQRILLSFVQQDKRLATLHRLASPRVPRLAI